MSSQQAVLETRDLTINFGGHVAVNRVSCQFHKGTLTSIVGPNGAGKTTWFNLISGQLKASAGQVILDGEDITGLPAARRADRGLGRAFQLLMPLLQTRRSRARLRMIEYRGKTTAAMLYDDLPINDVFRKLDDDNVLGIMDLKGMAQPFFFRLHRE